MRAWCLLLLVVVASGTSASNCDNCETRSTLGLVCEPLTCKHLSNNSDLCSLTPYLYSYCIDSKCTVDSKCSDGREQAKRFTTPDLTQPEISKKVTMWSAIVTAIGLLCLYYMRDKQPQRTRNLYLSCGTLISQLIHLRFSLNQTEYDPCLLTCSIVNSCMATEKISMLVQVYLYKMRSQNQKKLSVTARSLTANKDIDKKEATPFYHFLDTLPGAALCFLAHVTVHGVLIALTTDISPLDLEPCNIKGMFPGTTVISRSVGLPILIASIAYGLLNLKSLVVFVFNYVFWLMLTKVIVALSLWASITLVLRLVITYDDWLITHFVKLTFLAIISCNMFVDCILPMLYYLLFYKPRSVVTQNTRAMFEVTKKQPFSIDKLADFASTEQETESILLYHTIKTLKEQRSNVLQSDFKACERLATFIFENYIQGKWKTLEWYQLRYITERVTKPLDLIEKKSILDALEIGVTENIILPMYARMVSKT